MKYFETCKECGHKKTAYTYRLNKGRINALRRLVDLYEQHRRPILTRELGLSNAQYTGFCHLQYWDLIQKAGGGYIPTVLGSNFIYGYMAIPNLAANMAGENLPAGHPSWETQSEKAEMVMVQDIEITAYKQRVEYQAEKSGQLAI